MKHTIKKKFKKKSKIKELETVSQENTKIINGFKKDYFFLSNFYESIIYVDGKKYKSVEHAYQASKTLDENIKNLIMSAKSPNLAKRLGNSIEKRKDWDQIKLDLMKLLVKKKFENPFLRPLLVATNDKILINENSWHDKFWGIYQNEGENWLGVILMEIREQITQEDMMKDEI